MKERPAWAEPCWPLMRTYSSQPSPLSVSQVVFAILPPDTFPSSCALSSPFFPLVAASGVDGLFGRSLIGSFATFAFL